MGESVASVARRVFLAGFVSAAAGSGSHICSDREGVAASFDALQAAVSQLQSCALMP